MNSKVVLTTLVVAMVGLCAMVQGQISILDGLSCSAVTALCKPDNPLGTGTPICQAACEAVCGAPNNTRCTTQLASNGTPDSISCQCTSCPNYDPMAVYELSPTAVAYCVGCGAVGVQSCTWDCTTRTFRCTCLYAGTCRKQ